MKVEKLPIEGLLLIEPTIFTDDRGYFYESFHQKKFVENTAQNIDFVQDNQSKSSKGTLRGLHFQKPPHAQDKLIRVLEGEILDVVVDLRKSSPTYLQHLKVKLDAISHKQFFIPKGFAHAFLTLSDEAVIAYKCSTYYHKDSESGLKYNDPDLGIDWEYEIHEHLISPKDLKLPTAKQLSNPF